MKQTTTTSTLKNLWNAILAQPLDNRKWISDRLIENIHEEENEEFISKEEVLAGIDAGLKDMKAGRVTDAWELLKE